MSAGRTMLALDIGGTKMLAALVRADAVLESVSLPTPREGGPRDWLEMLFGRIKPWRGRYAGVGVAVTGIVDGGFWSPLNRRTLDFPDRFALTQTVSDLAGTPAFAVNDAQAAAWGEFRFGAGQGADIVFLTISTGIGGGIVTGGRLLTGLGGHFGLLRAQDFEGAGSPDGALEDEVSGNFIARRAAAHRPGATARDV
ncbi:ROK family protein, partial [Nitratireductor sp. ZSWI3]|uniref:ROK family protein n=1 Tax=Nitratireductor sp. ZSWI3 TaxID=2966359 RepID=UPI0021503DE3